MRRRLWDKISATRFLQLLYCDGLALRLIRSDVQHSVTTLVHRKSQLKGLTSDIILSAVVVDS